MSIYEDVRELNAGKLKELYPIDLICGGFPCQPFSVAGKRKGKDDDRHLWPEYFRLIQEIRPRWVIGENVAGLINMGLDQVLSDLESEGYRWEAFIIPACAVDAPHRRDRVWVVANSEGEREGSGLCDSQQKKIGRVFPVYGGNILADTNEQGLQGYGGLCQCGGKLFVRQSGETIKTEWEPEPSVGRVAYGISARVDRLKCLGNAVVPQVVEMIGHAIMEAQKKPHRSEAKGSYEGLTRRKLVNSF